MDLIAFSYLSMMVLSILVIDTNNFHLFYLDNLLCIEDIKNTNFQCDLFTQVIFGSRLKVVEVYVLIIHNFLHIESPLLLRLGFEVFWVFFCFEVGFFGWGAFMYR